MRGGRYILRSLAGHPNLGIYYVVWPAEGPYYVVWALRYLPPPLGIYYVVWPPPPPKAEGRRPVV